MANYGVGGNSFGNHLYFTASGNIYNSGGVAGSGGSSSYDAVGGSGAGGGAGSSGIYVEYYKLGSAKVNTTAKKFKVGDKVVVSSAAHHPYTGRKGTIDKPYPYPSTKEAWVVQLSDYPVSFYAEVLELDIEEPLWEIG